MRMLRGAHASSFLKGEELTKYLRLKLRLANREWLEREDYFFIRGVDAKCNILRKRATWAQRARGIPVCGGYNTGTR
jgi:hypothetical protein